MESGSDEQIISFIEQYMNGSNNADQVGYREQTYSRDFADKKRFLWFLKYLVGLGDLRNKRILDVGCGFGWHAFGLSLLAGNSIVGVDILPSMIEGMNESIATMRRKGVQFDVEGVCGDICELNFEPASFDVIYSLEAIEHVHDLQKMFGRCANLLRPGGKLILINDSNSLNRETRQETVEMWKKRETSWEWAEQLRKWRPIEHAKARPFVVVREEIVRAANGSLDERQVKTVVERTAGMLSFEIEQVAMNYRDGMKIPVIGEYDRCRNPETGEYAERLLDPYELMRLLANAGIKSKLRHAFRKFPLSLANSIQFEPLNRLLFNLRPVFIIVGTKL